MSVDILKLFPMAGALEGGIGITIEGSGFQPGASVYFGNQSAGKVHVLSSSVIETETPPFDSAGAVAVTVINPDDSQAVLQSGFVYISPTNENRAEIVGVSPLTVIEDTETEITLYGRNIIEAYDSGLIALRGPERVEIEISDVTTAEDEETKIEIVKFKTTVTTVPSLGPDERIAIQLLASRRPEAKDDLIVESSKQVFVVLPSNAPVAIAQTSSLSLDKPTVVTVLGRNLENCTFEFDNGIDVHVQKSSDEYLYALVSVAKDFLGGVQTAFTIKDAHGVQAGQYELAVAQSYDLRPSDPLPPSDDPHPTQVFFNDLIQVPNQEFSGPSEDGSKVYDLKGQLHGSVNGFASNNFGIVIFQLPIHLVIINQVYLFPLFDGGGNTLGSGILSQVGKLFPLRASGILFAARVEIVVVITVIVIITIYIPWLYGGFNEFPEQFPNAIGTVVSAIIIIEVYLFISILHALVLPTGRLEIIFLLNLRFGIDFTLSLDGLRLDFVPGFTHSVNFYSILPFAEQFPCDGRFQLADDNGQTVFVDQFGGRQSFYLPLSAGSCCVPWSFNIELISFRGSETPTVIQPPFTASYCLTATQPEQLYKMYIWSDPAPTGTPLTLEMEVGDTGTLKVLAQPVDSNGTPTGQAIDIRDLDHDVTFHLDDPLEVLDRDILLDAVAVAIQEGDNLIKAAVTSVRIIEDEYQPGISFYPGSIAAFNILQFFEQGEPPRVEPEGLPVSVELDMPTADYVIEPKLAYEVIKRGGEVRLIEIDRIERLEPHETPRKYVLAAKITAPIRTSDVTITIPSVSFSMKSGQYNTPLLLDDTESQFTDGRKDIFQAGKFFYGDLVDKTHLEISVLQNADLSELIAFHKAELYPNQFEEATVTGSGVNFSKVVPPGEKVTGRITRLHIALSNNPTTGTGATAALRRTTLDLAVQNEETYEEYYRVFFQIRNILHPPSPGPRLAVLGTFASQFHSHIKQPNGLADLIEKGKELWQAGYEYVQLESKDDRPLYYARLESIAVLRAHYKRTHPSSLNIPDLELNKFEWSSRGLETSDGKEVRIKFDTTTNRKVIVTGYDPFLLYLDPVTSNTSAIAALGVNKKTFPDAIVRSAIIPVRFRDFNAGFIEKIISEGVKEASIIMTCSLTPRYYLNIDRFATSYRTLDTFDNEYKKGGTPFPAGMTPYYIETSLPYETPNVFSNDQLLNGGEYLVLYQSFYQNSPGTSASKALHGTQDSYEKSAVIPVAGLTLVFGSGGNYLSNEIFYRTAKVRNDKQPGLLTGHLHIRSLAINEDLYPDLPNGVERVRNGEQIYQAVTDTISRFLNGLERLSFPNTKVTLQNTASISLNNTGSTSIQIASVSFASGGSIFQLVTSLPVTIPASSSANFQFKFTPIDVENYIDTVQLKNAAGKVLFCVQLEGKGIDPLSSIPPSITFPDTVINTERSITTRIKNLTANQLYTIDSAEIDLPFSLQTALPLTIAQGTEKTIHLKFNPTTLGNSTGILSLKNGNDVLLNINVSGTGIVQPPSPVITGFIPTSAYPGEEIIVAGQNFVDVIDVKIGVESVGFEPPSNPDQITIYAGNVSGRIKVITSYGTGESQFIFFVRPIRD